LTAALSAVATLYQRGEDRWLPELGPKHSRVLPHVSIAAGIGVMLAGYFIFWGGRGMKQRWSGALQPAHITTALLSNRRGRREAAIR
jgi:hypothetical protein